MRIRNFIQTAVLSYDARTQHKQRQDSLVCQDDIVQQPSILCTSPLKVMA